MKIDLNKIRKSLSSNPVPKILAVVIATILWLFVASSQSSTGKFPSKIQIITVNTPNGLIASYDQKTIDLEISAEPSLWQKLSTNSFTAYVDLGGLQVGTYELDVNVTCNVADVQILNKKPSKIFVQLENIGRKKVPVIQKVEGNAAEGMVVGAIAFDPAEVEISGPQSQIDNISNAVANIRLNGESSDFSKEVLLTALDDSGNEISNLSFSPSKVNAQISVVRGANNKTVGIKINFTGSLAEGYYISSLSTQPNTINITGAPGIISNINYIETQVFDISGIASNIDRDLLLKIPEGVALQKGEPNKIRVNALLTQNSLSKVVSSQIKPKNLDPKFKINAYAPNEVLVTISGSGSLISAISSSNIILDLDLAGKGAGVYNMELTPSMFQIPQGAIIINIVPSALQIQLSTK